MKYVRLFLTVLAPLVAMVALWARCPAADAVNGVELILEVKPATWSPGAKIELVCTAKNVSDKPIRIPAWGLDMFPPVEFTDAAGKKLPPPSYGCKHCREYVAEDFPTLAPGETKRFTANASLDAQGAKQFLTVPEGRGGAWGYELPDGAYQVSALAENKDAKERAALPRDAAQPKLWTGKALSAPVKVTVGKESAPAKDADAGAKPVAAERAKKFKGDLASFVMSLQYVGEQDNPFYSMTLATHGLRRAASYQFEMVVLIDKAEAAKVVDWLEKSGVLGWAWDLRGVEDATRKIDPGPGYAVYIDGAGMKFAGRLGWGKDLEAKLLGLRETLESEAARQMDVLLARLGITPPSPAAERAKKVKENLKDFTFHLGYNGIVEKPYYSLTVSTKPDTQKERYGMDPYVVVDEKQAAAIVDRLEADGFFRYAKEKVTVDPNTSCYILRLDAGGMHLEENLGWGDPLIKRLKALKAVLEGDAAEGLRRLLARIGG